MFSPPQKNAVWFPQKSKHLETKHCSWECLLSLAASLEQSALTSRPIRSGVTLASGVCSEDRSSFENDAPNKLPMEGAAPRVWKSYRHSWLVERKRALKQGLRESKCSWPFPVISSRPAKIFRGIDRLLYFHQRAVVTATRWPAPGACIQLCGAKLCAISWIYAAH